MKNIVSKYLLWIIIILGLIFRLIGLFSGKDLQYDEIVVWHVANKSLLDILSGNYYQYRFHPPFFYLFIKIWKIVSETEIWIRLPSVIAGVINIYLAFLIGKRLKNSKAGLISAFLLASSSYHIYWSIQTRFYEAVFTFSLLYLLLFLYTNKTNKPKWWVFLTVVGIIGFNIDYSFMWIYIVINSYFFAIHIALPVLQKRFHFNLQIRYWILSNIPIALTIIYYLAKIFSLTISSKNALDAWIPKTSLHLLLPTIFRQIVYFIRTNIPFNQVSKNLLPADLLNISTIILSVLVVFSAVLTIERKSRKKLYLILGITYLPMLVSFLASMYYPIFLSYNFIIVSIGIILLLGILSSRNSLLLFLILFTWSFVNLVSFHNYLNQPSVENWKGAIEFLQKNINNEYKLLFIPHYFNKSFFYYNKRYKIISSLPKSAYFSSNEKVAKKISEYQNKKNKHCIITRGSGFSNNQKLFLLLNNNFYGKISKASRINIYCN